MNSLSERELIAASDYIGRDGVHYLGAWQAPSRDGKPGIIYALYVLNVNQYGTCCDVGAHFGPEPWDYLSGSYNGPLDMFASEPLLHAIIRAMCAKVLAR